MLIFAGRGAPFSVAIQVGAKAATSPESQNGASNAPLLPGIPRGVRPVDVSRNRVASAKLQQLPFVGRPGFERCRSFGCNLFRDRNEVLVIVAANIPEI